MPTDDRQPEQIDLLLSRVRRHGRRRLLARRIGAATISAAVIAAATVLVPTLTGGGSQVQVGAPTTMQPPGRSRLPLAPPLRLPRLQPGQACPTTKGKVVRTAAFGGVSYGNGPVRLLVGNQGDPSTGSVDLGATGSPGLLAVETIWYAIPGYDGSFVVQGRNLTTGAAMPIGDASNPVPGPLEIPSGPTANTTAGYRSVPGATWVNAPGCYGWQIDVNGSSSTIVLNLLGGWLRGQILAVGGPASAASTALPGTVRIWRGPKRGRPLITSTVTTPRQGFSVLVPPGHYALTATSPRYNTGRTDCTAPSVTVHPYRATAVTLTCSRR